MVDRRTTPYTIGIVILLIVAVAGILWKMTDSNDIPEIKKEATVAEAEKQSVELQVWNNVGVKKTETKTQRQYTLETRSVGEGSWCVLTHHGYKFSSLHPGKCSALTLDAKSWPKITDNINQKTAVLNTIAYVKKLPENSSVVIDESTRLPDDAKVYLANYSSGSVPDVVQLTNKEQTWCGYMVGEGDKFTRWVAAVDTNCDQLAQVLYSTN